MNIEQNLMEFGINAGLEAFATGGGVDYLGLLKRPKEGVSDASPQYLVSSLLDFGSPASLDAACEVILFLSDEWRDYVAFEFASAQQAITAISDASFQAAAEWTALCLLGEAEADNFMNAFCAFTSEQEDEHDNRNQTYADISTRTLVSSQCTKARFSMATRDGGISLEL